MGGAGKAEELEELPGGQPGDGQDPGEIGDAPKGRSPAGAGRAVRTPAPAQDFGPGDLGRPEGEDGDGNLERTALEKITLPQLFEYLEEITSADLVK